MKPYRRIIEDPRVNKGEGCWVWTGWKLTSGYGRMLVGGKQLLVHRLVYEQEIGPLGALFACHHCDNPSCVRPSHLFAGTNSDNLRDAYSKGRITTLQRRGTWTACKRGHELQRAKGGGRFCPVCRADAQRSRRAQAI